MKDFQSPILPPITKGGLLLLLPPCCHSARGTLHSRKSQSFQRRNGFTFLALMVLVMRRRKVFFQWLSGKVKKQFFPPWIRYICPGERGCPQHGGKSAVVRQYFAFEVWSIPPACHYRDQGSFPRGTPWGSDARCVWLIAQASSRWSGFGFLVSLEVDTVAYLSIPCQTGIWKSWMTPTTHPSPTINIPLSSAAVKWSSGTCVWHSVWQLWWGRPQVLSFRWRIWLVNCYCPEEAWHLCKCASVSAPWAA